MKNEIVSRVETIDPPAAERMLAAGGSNRRLSRRLVARYASQMSAGEWELNGQPIIFDTKGLVMDGQHRLYACLEAGVAFTTLVIRGVDRKTFQTVDQGKTRTMSDVLGMEGHSHAALLAAVINLIMQIETAFEGGGFFTIAQRMEFLSAHPEAVASTIYADANRGPLKGSFCGALHYIGAQIDQEATECFLCKVQTGEMLDRDEPAMALRKRLLPNWGRHASAKSISRQSLAAICVKALASHLRGEGLHHVDFRPSEAFPVLRDRVAAPRRYARKRTMSH